MRALPVVLLLTLCGCQSTYEGPRPVQSLVNRLFQSHCNWARPSKPGTQYIDYDHGGGWVELGTDGKTHPIPTPPEKAAEAANSTVTVCSPR
jgi:hypothetical protein